MKRNSRTYGARKKARAAVAVVVSARRRPRPRLVRPYPAGPGMRGYLRTGGVFGRFRGTVASELKFIDCWQPATAVATTGTILPATGTALMFGPAAGSAPSTGSLVTIVQGDQEYQRVGRQIIIKKILLRYTIQSADVGSTFRWMLVQDTQANGAAPAVNSVIGFTGKTVDVRDFNNIENSRRFKVLFDKFIDVNAMTSDGATYNSRNLSGRKFMTCNIPIDYDSTATSGVISTVRSNNLFFIAVSLTGTENIGFTCRLRYTDT